MATEPGSATKTEAAAAEVRADHKTYMFPNVANYYGEPIVLERGEMQHLIDVDGERYLDFFGGILTVAVGHCHPKVVEAVRRQVGALGHTSTLYPNRSIVSLSKTLSDLAPVDDDPDGRPPKVFLTNSGTEADETAVITAKLFTGRQEIIALRHGYSGRSLLSMSLTGHAPWRHGGTHMPGIKHAHNAYCYRCAFGLTYPSCELRCATDMKELIQTETDGQVAALIAEPIQGVGGFVTPPPEFFQIVTEIVRQHGGIFICDEVQTGFGRTGTHWNGIEHWGVRPEIVTFAKGIANGMPMGATVARADVADSFNGLTISTFGGNPISCEASSATLEVMREENVVQNAEIMGKQLREGLLALQEKYAVIGDVRGLGLMLGVELVKDRTTKEPAAEETTRLFEATKKEGLLIGRGGLYGNVLRITPPMTIGRADVETALGMLDRAFAVISA